MSLQALVVFSFIWVSSIFPQVWVKTMVLLFFVIGTVGAIFLTRAEFRAKEAIGLSLMYALCFVIVFQLIGFNFHLGLVKDMVFFSQFYWQVSMSLFCTMTLFYFLCSLCLILRKKRIDD